MPGGPYINCRVKFRFKATNQFHNEMWDLLFNKYQ